VSPYLGCLEFCPSVGRFLRAKYQIPSTGHDVQTSGPSQDLPGILHPLIVRALHAIAKGSSQNLKNLKP
jgi:hypothetical protein